MLGLPRGGIVLSECTKPACVIKWKKKQEKRAAAAANGVGLTQVDGDWHDCNEDVNWDEAEDFNLLDQKSFSMNQVGFSFEFSMNQVGFSMNQGRQTGKVPSRFILLDSESTHCTFYTRS